MRLNKTILTVIAAVVLAGVCFVGGLRWAGNYLEEEKAAAVPVITEDLISQRLVGISELASVKYLYTNMGRFEQNSDFYGWKVPFSQKSFIVSYDGVIKAGIDLNTLKISVTEARVTVTIPEAKILSHTIDDKSLQVFDESKNMFNPITIEDYTGFSADEREKIETRAIENGMLTEAKEKAGETVRGLLTLNGVLPSEYELIIK